MTGWELHDFAIQIVRDHLDKDIRRVLSWSSDPEISPSLWFYDVNQPAYCFIKFYTYPDKNADFPSNAGEMQRILCKYNGYSVQVGFMNMHQKVGAPPLPLYRGYSSRVKFRGLEALPQYPTQ